MKNKYQIPTLLFILFILSGCDKEDKVLKELKEMNHRQDHQYKMQLLWKRVEELQSAESTEERLARERGIVNLSNDLLGLLNQLKEINNKNFTGTFSVVVRGYILRESSSFISTCFKLFLRLFTSSKNDDYIMMFEQLTREISYLKITILELENYPHYTSIKEENIYKNAEPDVGFSMEYINERIANDIEKCLSSIKRYQKKMI